MRPVTQNSKQQKQPEVLAGEGTEGKSPHGKITRGVARAGHHSCFLGRENPSGIGVARENVVS